MTAMKEKQYATPVKRFRLIRGGRYVGIKILGLWIYLSRDKLKRNSNQGLRKAFRRELFRERGHRCEICGRELDESLLTIHHIKKRADYPELMYEKSNVQILCLRCHTQLHQREGLMTGFTYAGPECEGQLITT